jgi:ParB-like nuclease domain
METMMSDLNLKARTTYGRVIIERAVDTLKPYARNVCTNSKKQLKQIASSIEQFGFVNPVLIGDDHNIIADHGRVEAAKLLGRRAVPTLEISHLSDAERRAHILADNKLALNAGWDNELLALELPGLLDNDFNLELTGFNISEIDFIIEDAASANPDAADPPYNVKTDGNVCGLGSVKHREFAFASGEMSADEVASNWFMPCHMG